MSLLNERAYFIYVIEDDEAIRESMIELLQSEGYRVLSASNGQVAIDYLSQAITLPDLILLDLMMPIKDGFQFCEEKALDPRIAHIPMIIMSADGHIEEKRKRAKVRDYLKKPVDIDEVLRVVKNEVSSTTPLRLCGD